MSQRQRRILRKGGRVWPGTPTRPPHRASQRAGRPALPAGRAAARSLKPHLGVTSSGIGSPSRWGGSGASWHDDRTGGTVDRFRDPVQRGDHRTAPALGGPAGGLHLRAHAAIGEAAVRNKLAHLCHVDRADRPRADPATPISPLPRPSPGRVGITRASWLCQAELAPEFSLVVAPPVVGEWSGVLLGVGPTRCCGSRSWAWSASARAASAICRTC